jgi:Tol biopolymer transport system component
MATSSFATDSGASIPSPRIVHDGRAPIRLGEPIDLASLTGRIVTDDFEDVFAMDVDGSHVVTVAGDPAGPEFDGAWSPDGRWIVYRDSTRGINQNDEIFIVRPDGTDGRNLTRHPADDWGPDWSPDGSTIVFNSDRGGGVMSGYLVDADGSNLRRIEVDVWVEYPSFSPDGTRIAFMGAIGSNYEIFVADLASGDVEQLTDSPGHDGWPSWSPDGSAIAFTSVRDDCAFAPADQECWVTDDEDEHHDMWLIDPDGANPRRVTPEFGHFVGWSPDSDYLLISGYALYVVRPDGTGRVELRAEGIPLPLGGIPDWR